MSNEELRKRIERDPRLKKDFDLLIAQTGLTPEQLLTGLRFDYNLMKADRQALLSKERAELWPISEGTLRRTVKNIRRAAGQIEATNGTEFSPALRKNIGHNFTGLPETLRSYAGEVERKVNLGSLLEAEEIAHTDLGCSDKAALALRAHPILHRGYHQVRLLRLVNAAREVEGLPNIEQRAFTIWLNRFRKEKKRNPEQVTLRTTTLPA